MEILDNTKCELGEGPIYDPTSNTLFWFDIIGKRMFSRSYSEAANTHEYALPFMTSCMARIDAERQILATEKGLYFRDLKTSKLTHYLDLEADNPKTRSNDGRVHPSGSLWLGTMNKEAEKHAGSIYIIRKDTVKRFYANITIPNGICFSPNGEFGYFTDTFVNILYRVALDPKTGFPIDEPSVFYDYRNGIGGLDGAVTDKNGSLWIALWGEGRILCLSCKGKPIATFDIPAKQPSCPAFVQHTLDCLVVTSAWQGMSKRERNAARKDGMLFTINPKVQGKEEPVMII